MPAKRKSKPQRPITRSGKYSFHPRKIDVVRQHADLPPLRKNGTRLLNKLEVMAVTDLSFPSILLRMQSGKFPPARESINGRCVWIESEIYDYIHALPVKTYPSASAQAAR